ncbi:pentatricopeptide repeat-containing protein At1g01970 isoform X1 [Cucurbita pepo subsp. pepo]|uniref:pentatricopeptide repeat-containing protein At1g01970 isoform X1 n=1 Tax=Cucurbita pepo subsp. pepo TaxID=3664 RepID=UPI000C9D8C17|nr:pentatricopeptide repeat-containing protein At1g01970 isoform X1 [Cucurbita pepo subsp. pepo]XP_023526281.1 pentatricopeptide repeat-containing protein At1g01970 isoform X1 [Cucurbita pepo subsp. pepo]
MGTSVCNILYQIHPKQPLVNGTARSSYSCYCRGLTGRRLRVLSPRRRCYQLATVAAIVEEVHTLESGREKPRFRWVEVGSDITEMQKQAISQLPPKMTKRCKAVMKQIICFSPQNGNLSDMLAAWVRIMKPKRADWLSVLKHLRILDHPLYIEVAEAALVERTFEASTRDYTKIIHYYGKRNQLEDAERILLSMRERGFACDQITLTTMIHIYSKADELSLAKQTFEELKLLEEPLDRRSYDAMIMAFIRAGMPEEGENILKEMDEKDIYAGSEVYKALLRAYSMASNADGAQRVFDAIQLAAIPPDDKLCGLLINAYLMAGQSQKAQIAFDNMRRAGLEPSDKCIALVLSAYEKENRLNAALELLIDLEKEKLMVGKEASEVLAAWLKRLGVVEEVELVLREYAVKEASG